MASLMCFCRALKICLLCWLHGDFAGCTPIQLHWVFLMSCCLHIGQRIEIGNQVIWIPFYINVKSLVPGFWPNTDNVPSLFLIAHFEDILYVKIVMRSAKILCKIVHTFSWCKCFCPPVVFICIDFLHQVTSSIFIQGCVRQVQCEIEMSCYWNFK